MSEAITVKQEKVYVREIGAVLIYSLVKRKCADCLLSAEYEYDMVIEKVTEGNAESITLRSVSTMLCYAERMLDIAHRCSVTPMCAYEFTEEYFASKM